MQPKLLLNALMSEFNLVLPHSAMMPRYVVKIITGSRLRAFTDLWSTVVIVIIVINVINVIDVVYGTARPINDRLLRLLRSSKLIVE